MAGITPDQLTEFDISEFDPDADFFLVWDGSAQELCRIDKYKMQEALATETNIMMQVTDPLGPTLVAGDGQAFFTVLKDGTLSSVEGTVTVPSTSGNIVVQIHNVTNSADIASLTIDEGGYVWSSYTIDEEVAEVARGDLLRVDIDQAGTDAKGLAVVLGFATS